MKAPRLALAVALLACRPDKGDSSIASEDTARHDSQIDSDSARRDTTDSTNDTAGGDTNLDSVADTGGETGSNPPVELLLDEVGYKFIGEGPSDDGTIGATAAAEIDSDAGTDLLFGKQWAGAGPDYPGTVYVVSGPPASGGSLADAEYRIRYVGDSYRFGYSVSPAGDTDADGNMDLLVGAPGSAGVGDPGQAFLFLGPITSDLTTDDAASVMTGERISYEFDENVFAGGCVASAGDTDGDGYDDILVTAQDYDVSAGAAYVLRGPVAGELSLAEADLRVVGAAHLSFVGWKVAPLGDTDGDGLDDVAFGQATDDGATFTVFLGPTTGNLTPDDADARYLDLDRPAGWGALANAGDLTADGYPDLWIGDVGLDDAAVDVGAAELVAGPLVGDLDADDLQARVLGVEADEAAGWSLAATGDVDGDGHDDVIVGTSPGNGLGAGHVWVTFGPFAGTRTFGAGDIRLDGDGDDDAGESVAPAGDIDGDGFAEAFVSGPNDDDGGTAAGAAWLVPGSVLSGYR